MYRYKLKNKVNNVDSSICIKNIKFYEDKWTYSNSRINLQGFTDKIIEERAKSLTEFKNRDLVTEKIRINAIKTAGKEVILQKKIQFDEKIRDLSEKQLRKTEEKELKKMLNALGFVEKEYKKLSKEKMVQLILLERGIKEDVEKIKSKDIKFSKQD